MLGWLRYRLFPASGAVSSAKSIYDISAKRLDGTEESLAKYKGKVLLIINPIRK
jgi:hypothetical protein